MVQDAAFFEKVGPGEISTRASKDITAIRTAFGEKLGYLIWSLSTVIAVSIILSFRLRKAKHPSLGHHLQFRKFSQTCWRALCSHPLRRPHLRFPRLGERHRRRARQQPRRPNFVTCGTDLVVCPDRAIVQYGIELDQAIRWGFA